MRAGFYVLPPRLGALAVRGGLVDGVNPRLAILFARGVHQKCPEEGRKEGREGGGQYCNIKVTVYSVLINIHNKQYYLLELLQRHK